MSIFDETLGLIEQNRNNKYNCIPYDQKLPRFCEFIPGVQKKIYTLLSGASGSGKTQLADDLFVFTPYDFLLENETDMELEIHYWSLELDKISKETQWISRRLYTHYGIRTGPKVLQSIGKNRVNDHVFMAIQETRNYFEKLEDTVKIYDGTTTPQQVINTIEKYAQDNGKVVNGIYLPNKPNKYVLIILDHYSLASCVSGQTIKGAIEEISRYMVYARNKYGYSPVMIQQQNSESENIEHYKLSKLLPSKDGLGESKLTYNDCDIAIGIFQPQKHEIKTHKGYNIYEMGDGFRYLNIFKNRYGVSNMGIGLYFDGAVSYFKELPKGDQMHASYYEMIKNRRPSW